MKISGWMPLFLIVLYVFHYNALCQNEDIGTGADPLPASRGVSQIDTIENLIAARFPQGHFKCWNKRIVGPGRIAKQYASGVLKNGISPEKDYFAVFSAKKGKLRAPLVWIEAKPDSILSTGAFYTYQTLNGEQKYFHYNLDEKRLKFMPDFMSIGDLVPYYYPRTHFDACSFYRSHEGFQSLAGVMSHATGSTTLEIFTATDLYLRPLFSTPVQERSVEIIRQSNGQEILVYRDPQGIQKGIDFAPLTATIRELPHNLDILQLKAQEETDIEALAKGRYPHLFFRLLKKQGRGKDPLQSIIGVMRDPTNLAVEYFYQATKTLSDLDEDLLGPLKADSLSSCGGSVFMGQDLKGQIHFYNAQEKKIIHLNHPDRDVWRKAHFNKEQKLTVAQALYDRWEEYWTNRSGQWTLLGKSKNAQIEVVHGLSTGEHEAFTYLCTHHEDNTGTFQWIQEGTLYPTPEGTLYPTNATHVPLTSILETKPCIIVDPQNPQKILGILQYKNGYTDIDFLVHPEENKKRLTSLVQQARDKFFLPSLPLSFNLDKVVFDKTGLLRTISFQLGGHEEYAGHITVYPFRLDWAFRYANSRDEYPTNTPPTPLTPIHPPLQLKKVPYKNGETFYLYSRNSRPSQTTIVMVQGGPANFYTSNFRVMAHEWCTNHGHTLLFPQETGRTGYGYSHHKEGLGEIHQGNLRQIISMIQDGLKTGLIPDANNIHLWGHSYGGYVAASLALRFPEFLEGGGVPFNFKSIITECPALFDREEGAGFRYAQVQSEEEQARGQEEWCRKVSPLSYVGNPLSAPLLIITGDKDVRCPVHVTQRYAEALSSQPNMAYLTHPREHELFVDLEKDLTTRFLLLDAWIKRKTVSLDDDRLRTEGIKIIFGKKLLLSPPPRVSVV